MGDSSSVPMILARIVGLFLPVSDCLLRDHICTYLNNFLSNKGVSCCHLIVAFGGKYITFLKRVHVQETKLGLLVLRVKFPKGLFDVSCLLVNSLLQESPILQPLV